MKRKPSRLPPPGLRPLRDEPESRHLRFVRGQVVHILLLSRRSVPGTSQTAHRFSRRRSMMLPCEKRIVNALLCMLDKIRFDKVRRMRGKFLFFISRIIELIIHNRGKEISKCLSSTWYPVIVYAIKQLIYALYGSLILI